LKIADFGLAKIMKSDSLASTQCGSPSYVAPEILRKQKYGKECDYWSLGIVVFIMLSGECPFYDRDNSHKLFEKILNC
jgi:calcium/calmodulin-dependent protein kinase I